MTSTWRGAPPRSLVLLTCASLSAVGRGLADSYAVFLLPLSLAFGWDRTAAASIYGALLLSAGFAAPVVGRIFDRWGPGALNMIGITLLGLGTAAAGTLQELWQFYIVIGIVCGCGAAAVSVFAQAALLSRWYQQRLTTALAVVSAVAGGGILIISPLAQFLIERVGWRDAYFTLGGLTLLIFLALALLPWKQIAAGRDGNGEAGSTAGRASGYTVGQAIRTRPFWALCMIHFLTANGIFAINPQIVAFLVDAGFPAMTAASAFGLAGAATTAGLLFFGWLADRIGKMISVTLSYSMTLLGFFILICLQEYRSTWLLVLFILVYGPSFGSRGPIISAMTAGIFGRGRNFGAILGAVSFGLGTGAAMGATVGGLLHDWGGTYDFVIAYGFATIMAAMLLFWIVPELRRQ